jgi:hypothetical protein
MPLMLPCKTVSPRRADGVESWPCQSATAIDVFPRCALWCRLEYKATNTSRGAVRACHVKGCEGPVDICVGLAGFSAERLPAELTASASEHSPSDILAWTNQRGRRPFQRWTGRGALHRRRLPEKRRRPAAASARLWHLLLWGLHSLLHSADRAPPLSTTHLPQRTLMACSTNTPAAFGSSLSARRRVVGHYLESLQGQSTRCTASPWPNACTAATIWCCCVEHDSIAALVTTRRGRQLPPCT